MAYVALSMVEDSENRQAKKSAAETAVGAAVNLTTAHQQIGNADGYFLGNSPRLCGRLEWTKGAGTTLTVTCLVSVDGTTYQRLPIFAAPSSGVSAVSVGALTFAAAAWDNDAVEPDIGASGVNYCAFEFTLGAYRYAKLYAKSDNASGSIAATSAVWAGRET